MLIGGRVNITWDSEDEGEAMTTAHMAVETEETRKIAMTIKITEQAIMTQKGILMITGEEVKIIHSEGNEGNGMVATLVTVTGIIGIETMKVKVMQIEVENGKVIEVKDKVIEGEGENGTMTSNISSQDTHEPISIPTLIITAHLPWDDNINIQSHMNNIQLTPLNINNTHHKDHQHNHDK